MARNQKANSARWYAAHSELAYKRALAWRRANPEKIQSYNITSTSKRLVLIAKEKDKPCADCGGRFHRVAMDFDHIRGTKLFSIGEHHRTAIKDLKKEIAKCEIVCSNCHRVRTFKRRQTT